MIRVENVHKIFKLGEEKVHALRGVNLRVKAGEFVFITGPSGSGKTTLLDIIGALSKPTKGRVIFDGKDVSAFNDYQLSLFRKKKIGFIFQTFNLIPTLTALENVLIPLIPNGVSNKDKKKAVELLSMMGLEKRINHRPNELSGGERQRVTISRALINDPLVILADEPTGELDSKTGEEVMDYMRKVNKEEGKTFVIVTHDLEYIKKKDTVHKLKDGKLVT